MPRALVVRRVHFNAAHRLHNPAHSDEWNRATFGPCNNANYHGHNYEVELCVAGEISLETGYVVDVGILNALFDEHVHGLLDHRNLNLDVPWFATHLPSAENIARFIWEQLEHRIPAGKLACVRLWETPRNFVEYTGA
ncbi:MAG: 6-carboxytetrahydropterin synthase [Gemmatimonadota bacterium]